MKKKYIITEEEFEEIKKAIEDTLQLWQFESIGAEETDENGEFIGSISMSKETFFKKLKGYFMIEDEWWVKEMVDEPLQQERENDAYDKGSAEATMVCNEKTIPHAIKQERERIIGEIEKKKIPDTMNGTFVREGGYNQALEDIIKSLNQ